MHLIIKNIVSVLHLINIQFLLNVGYILYKL
jgi:hypothetical protein